MPGRIASSPSIRRSGLADDVFYACAAGRIGAKYFFHELPAMSLIFDFTADLIAERSLLVSDIVAVSFLKFCVAGSV